MITVRWAYIKAFVDSRSVPLQWVEDDENYHLCAIDGMFQLCCTLLKSNANDDLSDFETNYKTLPVSSPNMVVTTQFEKNDKDLKLASALQDVDAVTGLVTVHLKVPGTPGSDDGRYVAGGEGWFDTADIADRVMVYIVDHDNILGYGEDFVLKSYTDDDADEENRGWRIPLHAGLVKVEPIGGYGFLPSGFYVKVVAQRDPERVQGGKFAFNIFWGKRG